MTASASSRWRVDLNASTWLALGFVAVFGYFDWIMHRSVATTVIITGGAVLLILFRRAIVSALNMDEAVAAIPGWLKPILAAVPAVAYFLFRGQGTSGSGAIVFVAMLLVVAVGAVFGPSLDRALAGFYRARNRVLPRPVRMVLAVVCPILVAFLVIHGSLADLPALFGGTTNHPETPGGREARFFLGTVLSAATAWLLLREAAAQPAGAATRPFAAQLPAPVPESGFRPTHRTPAAGMTAWMQPSGTAPSMPIAGGLGVQILARSGDWVQVTTERGWVGWVDGRLLDPMGGTR